jgi:septum site-determining protein MinC
MNSDSSIPVSISDISQPAVEGVSDYHIRLKTENGRILLLLPPDGDENNVPFSWTELLQQLQHRLNGGDRFWQPNTNVYLIARDRLMDVRQLQSIDEALSEHKLHIKRVYTSRRQTAVAAVSAGYSVEQQSTLAHLHFPGDSGQPLADPLYVHTTLRSGIEIRHPGTVIILGDVNPGSSVVADGDVMVWGNLRGVVQAGASGNSNCLITALKMEPTQIRIADYVARAPENQPAQYYPEVAYVMGGGIRIAKLADFNKSRMTSESS